MPFANTWDTAFEAVPADNEDINLGANRIRALKVAVRERMQVDHVWEDDQNDGQHNKLTLTPQVSAPSTTSPYGFLYSQTISSNTELLFKDSTGNVIQLTNSGGPGNFYPGDLNVTQDLTVLQAGAFGGAVSFATATVSGFAAFGSGNDSILQFGSDSYFIYDPDTFTLQLFIASVLKQTWS